MSGKEILHQIAQSPKVAAGVSAVTTGTGAGTILDWIPDDIGKLATLVGVILTAILICIHFVKLKKERLELEIMRRKERERLAAIQARGGQSG